LSVFEQTIFPVRRVQKGTDELDVLTKLSHNNTCWKPIRTLAACQSYRFLIATTDFGLCACVALLRALQGSMF